MPNTRRISLMRDVPKRSLLPKASSMLYKLYQNNEVLFAVFWIVIYCVLLGTIRGNYGDSSIWMLVALVAIGGAATLFITRRGLGEQYGLSHWPRDTARYWFFLPVIVLATGNLWGGFGMTYPAKLQVVAVVSMALVGYVEEVIFRGFLFTGMLKTSNVTFAIVVSALTFGIGHIVNLFTGQASVETVLQVIFAVAWGFILTVLFYKCGSLWPCILVHSAIDVCSTFSRDNHIAAWVYICTTIVVAVVYCVYLLRLPPESRKAPTSKARQG